MTDCHPEIDDTPLLGIDDHRKFQMLFGILQWMVTISKPELCHAISSLNRFGECSREGPVRCFGYAKTTINKQTAIASRPMQFDRTAQNVGINDL